MIYNGASDGGRGEPYDLPMGVTVALKLTASDRETVAHEGLWQIEDKKDKINRMAERDGRVYGFGRDHFAVVDLFTGEQLGRIGRVPFTPQHYSLIAGDHLFALEGHGVCQVIDISGEPKLVSVNQLGDHCFIGSRGGRPVAYREGYFNEGAQLLFSGNRIFVRSYDQVYCIGDPSQPMRLSEIHR